MSNASYFQFCPVAMAAEILCTRWTMVLVRELVAGSTRFNDIRRGVPRMSRTLLAQRLRELEAAGIVERHPVEGTQAVDYLLTDAGKDLLPLVEAFGIWGQKWVESEPSLERLDVSLLMWDMRRNLDPSPLPPGRTILNFHFPELAASKSSWWLIVEASGDVDLCQVDPGFDVDLFVTTDLRTMTEIWMGLTTVSKAARKLDLIGSRDVVASMQKWLGLSPFAAEKKLAS
ncbi:transcriptional regulator [Thioclava sediminum]|uniref:Transcriptional regulator n=1 Tax=Thioclava sediminum TaxID=1915319 RepID=A0ABX3MZY4_9RHOB|nr:MULTISPECIES: helix-turn-helix domain-containing protein [Thioclava]MAQ36550.1 transcriptional regulator [Thioclava sp.]OOY09695.1 transcriptional regulator [Thioclava sp. F36-7]OOY21092.1 transcriptional regulator [Thioclava sp. DLFJ5-1]OOY24947.1 transcriptional regulator [Thioclava sediminum]